MCIVARREDELKKAHAECLDVAGKDGQVIMAVMDASDAVQMVNLRSRLEKGAWTQVCVLVVYLNSYRLSCLEWGRLDTLLVVAGVSALRPLLEIAGVTRDGKKFNPQDCTLSGLQDGVRIAHAAMQGNYVGPLVAALTFVSHTF